VWDLYNKEENTDLYEILTNPQYGGRQPKQGRSEKDGTLLSEVDKREVMRAKKESKKARIKKRKEQEEKKKVAEQRA
jgi:hypothetical protein